jgi:hypothetical protein
MSKTLGITFSGIRGGGGEGGGIVLKAFRQEGGPIEHEQVRDKPPIKSWSATRKANRVGAKRLGCASIGETRVMLLQIKEGTMFQSTCVV